MTRGTFALLFALGLLVAPLASPHPRTLPAVALRRLAGLCRHHLARRGLHLLKYVPDPV
jgi:hypothetical protein